METHAQNKALQRQEKPLPPSIERTLNEKRKEQLAEILSQVCVLQKTYGKNEEELRTLVEGFAWALAEYQMPKIIRAMRQYVLSHTDIPTPADILKIIDRDRYDEEMKNQDINLHALGGDTPDNRDLMQLFDSLRATHGEAVFRSWFKGLRIKYKGDDCLLLSTPTRFVAEWINQHYAASIRQHTSKVWPTISKVKIEHVRQQ